MNLLDFIAESNAIEGVHDDPVKHRAMYEKFIARNEVTVGHLEKAALHFTPQGLLRDKAGMNVRVGNHIAPPGGQAGRERRQRLLHAANMKASDPFAVHTFYELQHPFMDGNGRTGRLLWLWQMKRLGWDGPHGFLQTFYYQTLAHQGR